MFLRRMVTITFCEKDEFTCFDGSCISMDLRCNGREDCMDASDEKQCSILKTFEGYNKILLPIPKENEESFILNISIFISNINSVDEVNGKLEIRMSVIRSWFNPQLRYLNLNRSESKNLLSDDDKKKMWIPYTVFQNLKDFKNTDRLDTVRISPNPEFKYKRGSKVNLMNYRSFSGSENALKYEIELIGEWSCNFNVVWFPFDSQICFLQFFHDEDEIALRPVAVGYTGPALLSQHYLKMVNICLHRFREKPGIVVELQLGRPLVRSILTIFLPTIVLIIISQMVLVDVSNHYDMVICVQLTLLLVLFTL